MAKPPEDPLGTHAGPRPDLRRPSPSRSDPSASGLRFGTSEDAIEGSRAGNADETPFDRASEYLDLSRRQRHSNPPLSGPEIERWRWLRNRLESALSKGSREAAPNQSFAERRFLRVPTRREIEFTDGTRRVRGFLTQVGEGGVFIATALPFERGTRIRLELQRRTEGGGEERIAFGGVVRWARFRQHRDLPAGMGLAFDELDERQYGSIVDLVEEALFLTLSQGDA